LVFGQHRATPFNGYFFLRLQSTAYSLHHSFVMFRSLPRMPDERFSASGARFGAAGFAVAGLRGVSAATYTASST
jgi:hypothetical protein